MQPNDHTLPRRVRIQEGGLTRRNGFPGQEPTPRRWLRTAPGLTGTILAGLLADPRHLVLTQLRLSARTARCLRNAKLLCLGDLTRWQAIDLRKLPGFGDACMREVRVLLADFGLRLSSPLGLPHQEGDNAPLPLLRRAQLAAWLAEGYDTAQIAEMLGVSRQTAQQWLRAYRLVHPARRCVLCGRAFTPRMARQRRCSPDCRGHYLRHDRRAA